MNFKYSKINWLMILLLFSIQGCAGRSYNLPSPPQTFEQITMHLYFDDDKAVVNKKEYRRLNSVIDLIESYPESSVVIEGHTDNQGTKEGNHALSHKRANAVKNYMVYKGSIEESRIKTVGYGESRPITSNKTQSGREQNRRVVILIMHK